VISEEEILQGAFNSTQDGINVTMKAGSVLPLPTGAATSALQTTGNSSLTSIDGKVPSKGQATMAASTPVVVASDQSRIPVRTDSPAQFLSAIVHETGKTLNAEDIIGPLTTPLDAVITGIVPTAAQPFRITQARLEIDSIVASVLAASIDVILYNDAAAVTPIAGNSQNTQLYTNGVKRMGRIQFGPFSTSGIGGSTMSAAFGSFQESKASFMDCFPVGTAISWRCVNKTTGTVFSTGQNVRLLLIATPL